MLDLTDLSGKRLDHPQDVLAFVSRAVAHGARSALVIVTQTRGGSVRAQGTLMAVREDGAAAGYVSNGCIDEDVILQAQQAIRSGEPRHLRYGEGSPFIDIRLPCGGAIDLAIVPDPASDVIEAAVAALEARRPVGLQLENDRLALAPEGPEDAGCQGERFLIACLPKLALRIAGRGAEPLALAELAQAAGFPVELASPDSETLSDARRLGVSHLTTLDTPASLAALTDDPWTAVALMFHDRDWEVPLLDHALKGNAFYIGALGSRRTHAARCEALRALGHDDAALARLHAPIGLVKSMRNAPMLGVSALAEIVQVFTERHGPR